MMSCVDVPSALAQDERSDLKQLVTQPPKEMLSTVAGSTDSKLNMHAHDCRGVNVSCAHCEVHNACA
jgi:hypothetical protein